MTLTMAMVTIATYSSAPTAVKWKCVDHVHPGYAGPWATMEKVLAHIHVTKCYESYKCILISYRHKCLHLCIVRSQRLMSLYDLLVSLSSRLASL
jgi:hypothetical protein